MPSLGYQNSHIKLWKLSFFFCFCDLETGDKKGAPTFQRRFCRFGSQLYDYFGDYKDCLCAAHTADIIDHYTERTSPRTNHLLPAEQQMESALNCFHFNTVEVPSRDPSWRAEGRRTAWLGWGSDRRSGSVVGQRRTQMLSGSVWRAVIVLHGCDLQSDNAVTPPSASRPTGRYLTANRSITFQSTLLRFTVLVL